MVQKTLDALQVVVRRQLREKMHCRIENMVQLRLKVVPAREACTRLAFGREIQLKARHHGISKICATALRPLKKAVVG